MSWYTDIKTWIANNIRTNHQREITGAKMNTVLNNIVDEVDRKVDKVSGKGLSTNDYNNTEKAKVANAYSKPSGGIPKTDLASAVQTSLGKADTAVQTETDPTVPSWAKAQTKPTYTASEVGAIPATDKGANGGVATLDNAGKVPQSQLPSYVDDVLEYANLASFPATGESGKIYVALDTNKTYRWSGSAYVEISQSLALGETSSTAFPGDRGKAIEDKIPSNASSSNKLATKAEMVPAGGTTGQVLAKKSNTDNDLEWVNQSGGGGTVDPYPTEDSTNPVQSGGVFTALANLITNGGLYGGDVTPNSAIPHGNDHRYFYLAVKDGVYTNFSSVVINNDTSIIYWSDIEQKWTVFALTYNATYISDSLAEKQDTISDLDTIRSGAAAGATAVQPGDLATVATSGSYSDLLNKPTIPAAQVNSDWNANSGVAQILNKPTIPDVSGKADKVVGATSGDVATLDSTGNLTDSGLSVFDFFVMVEDASTPPASMLPNTVYKYGTLSGNTTFPALATPTEPDIANVYCWTFATPSTAPTITWPVAITAWAGGSAPTINASKSYEVSVMDGLATIIEA